MSRKNKATDPLASEIVSREYADPAKDPRNTRKVEIIHPRKGTFVGKIVKDDGTYIDVEIAEGEAAFISGENAGPGDVISLRKEWCEIRELE